MKRIFTLAILVFTILALLVSCNTPDPDPDPNPENHQECDICVDKDDDGKCDVCGNDWKDGCDKHVDKNDDGKCDVNGCGADFTDGCDNHVDSDDDGVCDVPGCGADFTDGCNNHRDANDDGKCDNGGEAFEDGCDHANSTDNSTCSVCGLPMDKCSHRDADDNGRCDKCNDVYSDGCDVHRDADDNGVCDTDGCGAAFTDGCDVHRDADDNGKCDKADCGVDFTDSCDVHRDADDNGKCDKADCGVDFIDGCDNHRDANDDGVCDVAGCGKAYDDGVEGTISVVLTKGGDYKNKITFESSSVNAVVGADLQIKVTFAKYYRFEKSEPAGEYDEATGILTIKNIQQNNTRVTVYAREEYEFYYTFEGTSADTSSKGSGDFYSEGTEITVTAGDNDKQFVGWSFGKSYVNGGTIVSKDRTFTFKLDTSMMTSATNKTVKIYPNYIASNVYRYDPNGGSINTSSVNYKNTTYYSVAVKDEKLVVTLGAKYYANIGDVASTFYDDGTFYRDGYILMEYNTKPDGTGEGFNLGAKYAIESIDGDTPTLYCIWAKATPDNTFIYTDVTINRPSSTNDSKVPYWSASGVEITSYTGNDKTVVIPEKIGGKYVTSIAAGAFKDKDVETIIIGRRILRIADGAFKNCTSLKVMYLSDGVYYMSDSLMDEATKKNFTDLRVNAVMPPKYSSSAWAGLFAIKLTRVLDTRDTNRLIMIGGSSIYEGVGSAYLEALLNGDGENNYSFINFGTTRTLTIMLYLDAIDHYTDEDDMVIISPENHIRAIGDTSFVANSYDDSEGMYPSLMRYLDISNYTGVFTSLAEFNATRASRNATRYEQICDLDNAGSDKYGDDVSDYSRRSLYRNQSGCIAYADSYVITFNSRVKSTKAVKWSDETETDADWKNPNNETWCDFNDPQYANQVNRMIAEIKATGASCYYSFAPVDGTGTGIPTASGFMWGVIPECKADPENWLAAYDQLILDTFDIDGLIGKSSSYIYHHNYFFDNAYHLNNWGRTIRTYQLYIDLCDVLGITDICGATDRGTDFKGCLFEKDTTGLNPIYTVDWLK